MYEGRKLLPVYPVRAVDGHLCVYIYIYVERERENKREREIIYNNTI